MIDDKKIESAKEYDNKVMVVKELRDGYQNIDIDSNMEDKDITQAMFLRYKNGEVYFNGSKINAYTEEGMRQISNLLKKGLYEIGKELENISNNK